MRTQAAGPVSPRVCLTFAVQDRNPNLGSVAYEGPRGSFGPSPEVPNFPLSWGVPPPSQGL